MADPTAIAELLRELAENVKSLRGDLSTFAELNDDYFDRTEAMIARARQAAEEIEMREVASCAAMTCSLLAQYQSEVDVIESVAGFTDESTPVGEAWARICGVLDRFGAALEQLDIAQSIAQRAAADSFCHDIPSVGGGRG